MKKTEKKLLSVVLAVLISVISSVPIFMFAVNAQSSPDAADSESGKFCLVAESDEELIIEPEWVSYGKDDTVCDALTQTSHTFDGINSGFIYSIDGVIFSPIMRTSDNRVYEFEKKASEIANVFRFDTTGIPADENFVALLTAMADYNEICEYKDSDDVTAAYKAAKDAYIGMNSDEAKTYAQSIRDAMARLDGEARYKLNFNITQDGGEAKDYETAVYNEKGTEMKRESDGTYNLLSGTYSIKVSKDYNEVYGSVSISDADYTVSAQLPSGHSFDYNVFVSESYDSATEFESKTLNGKLSSDFSSDCHEYTVFASDKAVNPYINSSEKESWKELENKSEYFVYYTLNNPSYSSGSLGFFGNGYRLTDKFGGSLAGALTTYGAGATVRMTHEVEDENGFTAIQSYYINIVRIRTMKSLGVHDENGALAIGTESNGKVYTASVLDSTESVTIYPVSGGSYSEGYSIKVDSTECEENGSVEVALTETVTEVPVVVSHTDGSSNEYTVKITKEAAYESIVTLETEGATLVMTNSEGTQIAPQKVQDNVFTYQLVPGSTYTATASKGANRSIFGFPALNIEAPQFQIGKNIKLDVLEENNWLSDLAFGSSTQASKKGNIELDSEFDSTKHDYSLTIPESTTNPCVWATVNESAVFPAETKTVSVVYSKQPTSSFNIGTQTDYTQSVVSGKSTGQKLTALNATYGNAKTFEVLVSCAAKGITYVQVYTVKPVVYPTLGSLSVEVDGNSAVVSPTFNADNLEYAITASELAKSITVTAKLKKSINSLSINGKTALSGEAMTISFDEIENDVIPVTAINSNGTKQTYSITINKLPALNVSVSANPSNAVVFITDNTGARVDSQADGTYKMLAGATYNYTVSCKDYIAQSGTYTVPESGEGFSVTLEKAPINSSINKDLNASWPMFRGDNTNNGIISSRTPKSADEAVLYWATQDGEGFDSNAIGCPIIVNDYLVYCTGDKLHRMDRRTGEVDELEGTMVAKSSFNIIPPTYADGMIFVALSNGTIQAFNAETFESLWVYYDALGGQPNSPIVYNDGYVYTGFWVGETKRANFVCLSATDENPEETNETKTASWTYTQLGGFYWAGAYVCDEFVLVGTDDGDSGYTKKTSNLLSFDSKTGELKGKIENLNADIRSSVSYDEVTDRYYFTTKGGSFYSVAVNADGTFKTDENGIQGYDLKEITLFNYAEDSGNPPMSTCTPVVHNGRAYIGVSGTAQFGAYSGHNITVIDLESMSIAYTVRTKGYPQTSGLLTTAYESEDGYAYIYFIDNYTPGQVRVIKDKPGVTEVVDGVKESYMNRGEQITVTCAPVLFTPSGAHAQYAICSPISDENGTLYFKNDSAYMMAVGSKVESIRVTCQPSKTLYTVGEPFDKSGMTVTAKFANGLTADVTDYVTFNKSSNSFSTNDTDVTVYYETQLYGDEFDAENGNKTNVEIVAPECYVPITVLTAESKAALESVIAKIDAIGEVTLESENAVTAATEAYNALDENIKELVSNSQVLANAQAEYAAIKNVYDKIEAIGDVTFEKSGAINEADEAYKALTNEQRAKITNASVLENAISSLNVIVGEINEVINKIDAIGTVTMDKEADIVAAGEAYEALAETSKAGVSNADKLFADQAVLLGYKGDVKAIEELIDAIGEVTYEKKGSIEAARAGYNALSDDLRSAVSNYEVLVAAEAEIAAIYDAVAQVEAKINDIGTVLLSKKDKIDDARKAYDALPDGAKALVSNYETLEKAEKILSILDFFFGWIVKIYRYIAPFFKNMFVF